ncbi:hypothetical protein [Altererythrobacter sp. Z27]|uniref:hypothetical protein n=1 Tax=Altererythrobacter sp. Z27 TaxID=3461147 RepID=UPI004045081B
MNETSRLTGTPADSLARKWKSARQQRPTQDLSVEPMPLPTENPPVSKGAFEWHSLIWPALGLAPLVLNGLLAIISAHVFRLGFNQVALAELLLLSSAIVAFLLTPKGPKDLAPVALLVVFILIALWVSLLENSLQVGMIRNIVIVTAFTLVGLRYSQQQLRMTMNAAVFIVTAILVIEILSVGTYVAIFQPAEYFAATRGLDVPDYDESGLFGNALGWEGRFSLFNIMDHRGSSVFLEQVSLGNFAMISTLYVYTFWTDLSKQERIWLLAAVALMCIATASRTASALFVLAPLIAITGPKLPRLTPLTVLPLCLIVAVGLYNFLPPTTEDNLAGRIGYTMRSLSGLELSEYLGTAASTASDYVDSGYVYIITASTVFGLIAYWLFASLFSAGETPRSKVCAQLTATYVFMNMLVSGTSIFSVKTAPFLWLIVGCVAASMSAPRSSTALVAGRRL